MHRLATVPGEQPDGEAGAFIEQPPAPVVLLSSADTDLVAIERLLRRQRHRPAWDLRALNLAALAHPATIDHYVASSLATTRIVVVRLLGGRGHWSYGLERLRAWSAEVAGRQLLVLAGTAEEEAALAPLGTVDPALATALAGCMREGGEENLGRLLESLDRLLCGESPSPPPVWFRADPQPHDWRSEQGPRVGVILYRALHQAGDHELVEALLRCLRRRGLCPRALWVSGLRDEAVQRGVGDLLAREGVDLVLCTTGFASVRFEEAGLGAPLWDRLGVPVLQVLCSAGSREQWRSSSVGLGPLDLSLQVVLPELDGRITTRVGAFKESGRSSSRLATALHRYAADPQRLDWVVDLSLAWIRLRQTAPAARRIALVLANYPTRDGRLANGVGLDTPASAALMLRWLEEAGHRVEACPGDGEDLIRRLLAGRSNDPEGHHRPPHAHLPLTRYLRWYGGLPAGGRERLEAAWGPPERDAGLERSAAGPAFPIHGCRCGSVVVLVQPDRGYDRDPARTYHSPDLPPTHAYLAQYLWLRQVFDAHVVVHVGKHGNLEWLPGKGVGLSPECFPEWALGPLPHLYPFIVNDPGEGAQAKRRAQAVILDHLTPPLGRAGLHGELLDLEGLLDEYWETLQLGGERSGLLREKLGKRLEDLELPMAGGNLDERLEAADGYLCELKEAQIRLGLHVYGTLPEEGRLTELALCLARPPQGDRPGLPQAIAMDLGLSLDPWADPEEAPLGPQDQRRLQPLQHQCAAEPGPRKDGDAVLRRVGDAVALIEEHALALLAGCLGRPGPGVEEVSPWTGPATRDSLEHIRREVVPRLMACPGAERQAFLRGVAGGRIAAGPSGAPTRGRIDLLPTGRNFYSVDLRGLPTEAAWDLGRRSAELLLELHLQEEGEHLRSLALSVWGTATMRNGGEDIAQALALMGVRPVWDGPTRRMVGLEVVPLKVLGRPRVDVTLRISGLFRDAFPQLVSWINRACRLVAALDEPEPDNPLAAAARREGSWGRVYGSAPGAYGAGLQALIDSGRWETRQDLAESFLSWSGWRYDDVSDSEPAASGVRAVGDREGLERRLSGVEVVLHNQDNREHDLLDSDDYYQFQGGLHAAVEHLRGRSPGMWFGDHSRHSRPRVHRLEREFDKVIRSRLLNPRWIEGMLRHGYKGGFELAASLDYLFAYDACTGRMPDWAYGAVADRWLGEPAVVEKLRSSNPWSLRDMAERLLEAHHRGMWQGATEPQRERLRQLVLEVEAVIEKGGA